MTPRPLRCDPQELRSLFLFEKQVPERLARLCQDGHQGQAQPGPAHREGEPATQAYVLPAYSPIPHIL